MGIKKTLWRIVLSGALALGGCQSNIKTESSANNEYLGIVSGDFNGDGESDVAFINIRQKDISLYEKSDSLESFMKRRNSQIDWDKVFSKTKYLKLVIMDFDKDPNDLKAVENYLMDSVIRD